MNNQGNPWISIRAYFQINGIKVSQPKVQTKEEIDWLDLTTPSDTRVFKAFNFSEIAIGPDKPEKPWLSTPEQPYCDCPTSKYCVRVKSNSGEEMIYCHNCHRERLDSVLFKPSEIDTEKLKCIDGWVCPHGGNCNICNCKCI